VFLSPKSWAWRHRLLCCVRRSPRPGDLGPKECSLTKPLSRRFRQPKSDSGTKTSVRSIERVRRLAVAGSGLRDRAPAKGGRGCCRGRESVRCRVSRSCSHDLLATPTHFSSGRPHRDDRYLRFSRSPRTLVPATDSGGPYVGSPVPNTTADYPGRRIAPRDHGE